MPITPINHKTINTLIIELGECYFMENKDYEYLDLFNKIIHILEVINVAPEYLTEKQSFLNDCRLELNQLQSLPNIKNNIFLEKFSILLEKVIQLYIWLEDIVE